MLLLMLAVILLHIAMDKQANVNDALAYVENESEIEREIVIV